MSTIDEDIRWQQRFSAFQKAWLQLGKFIDAGALNDLEIQGLIKAFEYTYELSWKTLQDFFKSRGYAHIIGPRAVIGQAIEDGLLENGRGWMEMHKSRNLTSHTYDEETAREVVQDIRQKYHQLFTDFKLKIEKFLP